MCCEATDALLEYVRRYLGLTGLRNLNAPRRLKLRVPVLKEWLQRQGQSALANSIPDWDPVRRPTGRWKAWEMAHLKPIMDEKAVERQAKRNLVSGEAKEEMDKAKRNDAVDALSALASAAQSKEPASPPKSNAHVLVPAGNVRPSRHNDGAIVVAADESRIKVLDDCPNGEGSQSDDGNGEGSQSDDTGITSSSEALRVAVARIQSVRQLLLRMEPGEPDTYAGQVQSKALYDAIQAVDNVNHLLNDGSPTNAGLLACQYMQDPGTLSQIQRGMPQQTSSQTFATSSQQQFASSQEEAALLLGASQVSLTGLFGGASQGSLMEGIVNPASQESLPAAEPSSSADENEADEQHGNKRQRVAAGGKELSVKNEVLSPPSQVNAFELIEAN